MKQQFHTPEYVQRRRNRLIRIVSLVGGGLLVIIGICIGLTHFSKLRIDTITVDGTHILSASDIQIITRQFIGGDYLYVFAKDNALLYPRGGLQHVLLSTYPRIGTVYIDLQNYHTVHVTITERQPFALWCGSDTEVPVDVVSQCYFLDRSGFVFSPAPHFSGDAYFKYYGLVPYASPVGSSYLSSSDIFTHISDFVSAVKALHITPLYLVAKSQHEFELHLYGGGILIFDDAQPFSQTAEYLAKLLTTAHLVPQKNGELLVEYIDLRFGNKLYYKVK